SSIRHRAERRYGELLVDLKATGQIVDGRPKKPLPHEVGFRRLAGHFLANPVSTRISRLIPVPIDQNPCAHWRSPMAMMRQGWSTSLFQALQQWSTRSS